MTMPTASAWRAALAPHTVLGRFAGAVAYKLTVPLLHPTGVHSHVVLHTTSSGRTDMFACQVRRPVAYVSCWETLAGIDGAAHAEVLATAGYRLLAPARSGGETWSR